MTTDSKDLEGSSQRTARRVILWGSRALGYLVYAYVLVVELVLVLGFVLLLFGANPSADFTDWIYRSLDRAMKPFRGIFTPIELGASTGSDIPSVFETSVLFAMIIYGVVALAVGALITWLTSRLARVEAEEAAVVYQRTLQDRTAQVPRPPTRPQG